MKSRKIHAPAIVHVWERAMWVGCNHGYLACPTATKQVLQFCEYFNPRHRLHLGDNLDTTCFRAGAVGTQDETSDPRPDMSTGLRFLNDYRPTVYLLGNHEHRLWKLRDHPKAIVATLASSFVEEIRSTTKRIGATLIEYEYKAHHKLADVVSTHGTIYNENSPRDMAEMWHGIGRKVVFAHTHRAGQGEGRTALGSVGYCVGTLSNIPNMDFAAVRRSTLGWSAGFVWGEVCPALNQSALWLHVQPQDSPHWRLPI